MSFSAVAGRITTSTNSSNGLRQQDTRPTVATLTNGNYVVAWTEDSDSMRGRGNEIRAQIFGPTGSKIGGEFTISSSTAGNEFDVSISALSGADS